MSFGLALGLGVLTFLGLVVAFTSRNLESPVIDNLPSLPDDEEVFIDPSVQWTMLPYAHAVINTLRYRAGAVRASRRRLVLTWRPPLWRRDVIAAIVYRDEVPSGTWDPLRQTYPAFAAGQTEVIDGKGIRIRPRVSDPVLPLYVEIVTQRRQDYVALLTPER